MSDEEEECKIQKYNILHTININSPNLTIPIVDKFRDSNSRYIVRNIKHCFAFIRNDLGNIERIPTNVLIKENATNLMLNFDKRTTFLDQKKCITQFNPTKLDWLNSRIRELGFNYLLSPEPIELELFDTNMNNYYRLLFGF